MQTSGFPKSSTRHNIVSSSTIHKLLLTFIGMTEFNPMVFCLLGYYFNKKNEYYIYSVFGLGTLYRVSRNFSQEGNGLVKPFT